jgi:hypothetical protein
VTSCACTLPFDGGGLAAGGASGAPLWFDGGALELLLLLSGGKSSSAASAAARASEALDEDTLMAAGDGVGAGDGAGDDDTVDILTGRKQTSRSATTPSPNHWARRQRRA